MHHAHQVNGLAQHDADPSSPSWTTDIPAVSPTDTVPSWHNPLNDVQLDPIPSNLETLVKCSQCAYLGPLSSFPLRLNGIGHLKTCIKHTKRRIDTKSGHELLRVINASPISWEELLMEIRSQSQGRIDIDRHFIVNPDHPSAKGDTFLKRANAVMEEVKQAAGYRFNYKRRQDSTLKARKSSSFTYYCAQLEGEQTKHSPHPDETRRRPKKLPKIPRFACNGWATLTVTDSNTCVFRLKLTHAFAHVPCFTNRPAGVGTASGTRHPAPSMEGRSEAETMQPQKSESNSPLHDVPPGSGVISTSSSAAQLEEGHEGISETRSQPSPVGPAAEIDPGIMTAYGEYPASPVLVQSSNIPEKVCFPPEYLAEVRRGVAALFVEAERDGGLLVSEAQALGDMFNSITTFAMGIEAKNMN